MESESDKLRQKQMANGVLSRDGHDSIECTSLMYDQDVDYLCSTNDETDSEYAGFLTH